MLISGSNDREIRVWNADTGATIRVLSGHAHWVNKLALSSASVLRTGQFDHHGKGPRDPTAAQQVPALPQVLYAMDMSCLPCCCARGL
jgi:ribosome assembly protein 4